MSRSRKSRLTAGLVLIAVGVGFFLLQRTQGIPGSAVLLVLGAAFLTAYLLRRHYGFMVPAGVLLGLGSGDLLDEAFGWQGDATLLGLALGFGLVWVVPLLYERKNIWWPLIPAAFLTLAAVPRTEAVFQYFFDNWPIVLVVVGVFVLFGAFGRDGSRSDPPLG